MMVAVLAAAVLTTTLTSFEGQWRCEGHFISSGKAIVSQLTIQADAASGTLVVHHDDTAPTSYHSLETWTVDPKDASVHAAVSSRSTGLRVFRSPPMAANTLVFVRPETGPVQEEFRYSLKAADVLQVDWSVARAGQALQLGDTLSCRRDSGSAPGAS